jgi:ATP-dependent RNA helicase DDX5/DBP2
MRARQSRFFSSANGRLARGLIDILKEAAQTVPPKLEEFSYSGGGGRGGGRFGGGGGGRFGGSRTGSNNMPLGGGGPRRY